MARAPHPGKPIPATLRGRCDSAAPARCVSRTMRAARSPSHANATAQRAGASRMSRKSCAWSAAPCLRIEQCAYGRARYESGFSRRPRRSHRQHRAHAGSPWSGRAMPRMPDSQSPIAPCHRHTGQLPSPLTVFAASGSLAHSFAPPIVRIALPRQGCRLCRSELAVRTRNSPKATPRNSRINWRSDSIPRHPRESGDLSHLGPRFRGDDGV